MRTLTKAIMYIYIYIYIPWSTTCWGHGQIRRHAVPKSNLLGSTMDALAGSTSMLLHTAETSAEPRCSCRVPSSMGERAKPASVPVSQPWHVWCLCVANARRCFSASCLEGEDERRRLGPFLAEKHSDLPSLLREFGNTRRVVFLSSKITKRILMTRNMRFMDFPSTRWFHYIGLRKSSESTYMLHPLDAPCAKHTINKCKTPSPKTPKGGTVRGKIRQMDETSKCLNHVQTIKRIGMGVAVQVVNLFFMDGQ